MTQPYICQVGAFTATTYSGKCWQVVASQLPGIATQLLGLTISPFVNPAAGVIVMVVGRQ